jgi:glutathione S-transferase
MTDPASLRLYDFALAPSARRARMFIAEKGLDIPRIKVDLRAGEHLAPAYLAISPQGLVPALRLPDGQVIGENDGIAAYLEAAFPEPPLLGTTPLERGRVMEWNARISLNGMTAAAEALRNSHPSFAGRALPGVGDHEQIPALAERGRTRLRQFFEMLDRRLAEAPHLAGERFTMADITAVVLVDFARAIGMPADPALARLAGWAAHVAERPSYKA